MARPIARSPVGHRRGQAGAQPAPVQPVLQQRAPTSSSTTNDGDFSGNIGAVFGDPQFVGPVGPATRPQNFELQPTSPAINAARSEIGPLPAGDAIYPDRRLIAQRRRRHGTRTDPTTLPFPEPGPRRNRSAASAFVIDPTPDRHPAGLGLLQLPGRVGAGPHDRPQRLHGPVDRPRTYNYAPITGQRDISGLHPRSDDPSVPGTGFGSNPFIDIGAYST